jgi:hypothetical protein
MDSFKNIFQPNYFYPAIVSIYSTITAVFSSIQEHFSTKHFYPAIVSIYSTITAVFPSIQEHTNSINKKRLTHLTVNLFINHYINYNFNPLRLLKRRSNIWLSTLVIPSSEYSSLLINFSKAIKSSTKTCMCRVLGPVI